MATATTAYRRVLQSQVAATQCTAATWCTRPRAINDICATHWRETFQYGPVIPARRA